MASGTDLRFAVNFYPDMEVTASACVPGGTNPPSSATGISVTLNSAVITGPNGWTAGMVNGNRIQVAYQPAAGGANPDSDLSGWLKAFDWYNSYATSITATQVTVTQSDLITQQLSGYTYNNAAPPVPTPLVPLTVRWWDSTVDPAPINNSLLRYGGWTMYAKSGVDAEGTLIVQQQNFTSFNLRAITDNNATGSGQVNLAITPGNALFFCDADIKDNVAGFGLGYLSRKRWDNYEAAVSCSNVDSGTQAYVGAILVFPPVPGFQQLPDSRRPYNVTSITTSSVVNGVTQSTQSISNNGQVVGISTTVNALGNLIWMAGAPTIANAAAGRQITIINVDPLVTFRLVNEADSTSVLGVFTATNLFLQAPSRDIAPNATITLTYTVNNSGVSYWFEEAFAATGGAGTDILNAPLQFLSQGSSSGDPFSPNGFLYLTSAITLGSATTLSNFLRYAPEVTFQTTASTGTHNAFAVAGSWLSDSTVANPTIGDVWCMVDSRQFIARGVTNVAATSLVDDDRISTVWHNRTYWGDLGATWDSGQTLGEVGERFDCTLKGLASLQYRKGTDYRDTTHTSVTYAGATVTVTNVQATSGVIHVGANTNSISTPTTGRNQNGFPFLHSDIGKTITHPGWAGSKTITNVTGNTGQGQYNTAWLNSSAGITTTNGTATITDPSVTYTPTAIPNQTAHQVHPLTHAGSGGDDNNRGLDVAAACYFGGNIYGGYTDVGGLAANAVWKIANSTGNSTFGTINSGAITSTGFFTETTANAASQAILQRSGSQVVVNNNVAAFTGTGVDAGAVQRNISQLLFTADGTITSGTNAPGRISFLTSSTTASLVQRGVFDSTGSFGIGTNTTPTSNPFSVTSAGTVATSSSVLSSSATAGIGYSTGAGGTATQATSKATAFPTISKVCGTLTWNAASLAADTTVTTASSTNAALASTDIVIFRHISGGTLGAYNMTCTPGSGTWTLTLHNTTGAALAEAPVFAFAIIKAVTA